MGRMNRKIKKQLQQVNQTDLAAKFSADLATIRECKDNGKYDEALTLVIRSFETYGVKGESAYETAEIYYLSGDYEHTATWCDNTLSIEKNHIGALLLLAKLALLRDQLENVLGLLDKVVHLSNLDLNRYHSELKDILDLVLIDYEPEMVAEKYPDVWQCLHTVEEIPGIEEAIDATANDTIDDTSDDIREADIALDTNEVLQDSMQNIESMQAEIMAMSVSLKEKLALCNQYAGEYYLQGKLDFALGMLRLGLAIDATDEMTLKNIGVILYKSGERSEARGYLSRLTSTDLMVLELLHQK